MGRKRRRQNSNLPKYVYQGRVKYVYRPYICGKRQKEQPLCPLTATTREIWEAYEELTGVKPAENLEWLIGLYMKSEQLKSLKPLTQRTYRLYQKTISEKELQDGATFGSVALELIDHTMIRAYLDSMASTPVEGNRKVAFLGSVYKWGFQRGHAPNNPCLGITKYKETPRKLYVTDAMYDEFYQTAKSPWYIQPMMEIAYLCRMRRAEILDLKKSDILLDGLDTRRLKNSNKVE